MKRWLNAVIAMAALATVVWALSVPHGRLPPLGRLLDPCTGFWQNNAATDDIPERLTLPGLRGKVTVVWDDGRVPHIFAENEEDLYRAQGFLTARDRLWQMEFLSRFAGGRLAEVIGPPALELDRFQRRLGLPWGAENFVKGIAADAAMSRTLAAYCDGVNAHVDSLKPAAYPLEYKILGYAPSRWTAFDIGLLLKYMAWDLTGFGRELSLTRARQALGQAATDDLFPFFAPFQDPVIPSGTTWDFAASAIPEGKAVAVSAPGSAAAADPFGEPVGSNNWVVSGTKTKSGFPILCDDPHLQLTLPSIWYEVQLAAPGLNVRGVSMPGTPGVVIGFNEKIAWGVTNAGSDVLDFYAMTFRDKGQAEYAWGDGWRETTRRPEEIIVRGSGTVVEEVLYTHLGPVPFPEPWPGMPEWIPAGAAMRWTGHDASGIMNALHGLNRARGYGDFKAAIARFDSPAQNIAYAGSDGHVAIWHNGKFPLRARGQGRFLLDGSDPGSEWAGWVPIEQVPHMEDPERGFVSSANQSPTDGNYPHYLGWDYATFERGRRINELLKPAEGVTAADMARMQGDALSLRARTILPRLLSILEAAELAPAERERAGDLARWDFVYRADTTEPTVFSRFFVELYKAIWDDELEREGKLFQAPAADVTMALILSRPDSPYFDDVGTAKKESLSTIVRRAFQRALEQLREKHGAFGPRWRWGQANPVTIGHLGRMPGLGAAPLAVSGGRGIINAASQGNGPSWRMVVELGPEVRAWGSLPGGSSGNPGSRFYDSGIADWAVGKAVELLFLKSAAAVHPRISGRTEIGGGQ